MSGDTLTISAIGRPAKYRQTFVRMLAIYNSYGIIALFSDESKGSKSNRVGELILERWERDKEKIVEEFGDSFLTELLRVNLLVFDREEDDKARRYIEVIKALTFVLERMHKDTKFINFDISAGRRMLAPFTFLMITYLQTLQSNITQGEYKWLKNVKIRFITKPIVEIDEGEPSIKETKSSKTSKPLVIFHELVLNQIPFLYKHEYEILKRWNEFSTQKELAEDLEISNSKISVIKKEKFSPFQLIEEGNQSFLTELGESMVKLYSVIYR